MGRKGCSSFLHTRLHPALVRLIVTADTFCSSPRHMLALVCLLSISKRSSEAVVGFARWKLPHWGKCFHNYSRQVFCVFWGHWPFSKSEWLSIIQCGFMKCVHQEASRQWASLSSLQNSLSHDENWQKTIYNRKYVFSFLLWGGASPFWFTLLFCAASVYATFTWTKLVRRSSLCFWMNVHHQSCCLDNEIYYISSSMKLGISSLTYNSYGFTPALWVKFVQICSQDKKINKFAWAGASNLLTGYVHV